MEINQERREEFIKLLGELEPFYMQGVTEAQLNEVSVMTLFKAINDYLNTINIEEEEELIAEIHKRVQPTLDKLSACVLRAEYDEIRLFNSTGFPDLKSVFTLSYALTVRRLSDKILTEDCEQFLKYINAVSKSYLDKVDLVTWKLLRLCAAIMFYYDFSTLSVLSRTLLKQAALEARCQA